MQTDIDRLQLVMNEIDNPIVVADKNFEIEWVNPSFTRMFGFTLEEFKLKRGKTLLQASENPDLKKILNEAIKNKRVVKYESRNTTADGRELWISSTVKPVFDDEGELNKIIIIDLDVHEKKKIQEKLVLTDSILQKVGSLVLVADSAGKIVYVSPSVSKMLGYSSKEIMGTGWWNLSRKTVWDSEKEREFVSKCATGVLPVSEDPYEKPIVCKDGKTRWILWKDTKGPADLLIGVGQDITERKKDEEIIRRKNKDITDSINYATRIQHAVLPSKNAISEHFPESFVLYKPKDIVSGDFYWFTEAVEEKDSHTFFDIGKKVSKETLTPTILIAAADCTGHGVPGALMSVAGTSQLFRVVREKGVSRPGRVLTQLNRHMKELLHQTGHSDDAHDGMDIALCSINKAKMLLDFAGANRNLFLYRNGVLKQLQGNKNAIGGTTDKHFAFNNHRVELQKGDMIYVFTDGYADQFGGPQGKKFLVRRLKELFQFIHTKPVAEQDLILRETFEKWRGSREQVDDVLLIGIRL